ncbi:MAG: class I SAM-dependent methyltransferase [bacterium]|nr:class I SAM-dependent methyltransferase [bacterium]
MNGFLNPAEVLKQLKLKKTMTAVDFGCGSGFWVLPLARILEEGRVYGVDILEEPLSALRSKAKTQKLPNIISMKANVERGTTLLSGSCDLVLMTNLLFQAENKKGILEEGKRVLKPGGKILVVDWKKDAPLGPEGKRVLPEEIKNMAKELGLESEKEFEASPYHWGLILAVVEN